MADFDFGEFLRQKRIQDAVNAHDPSYNPDDATHWISSAQKIASPEVNSNINQDSNTNQIQFPQFTPDAAQAIGSTQPSNFKQPNIGPEESKYRELLSQTPLKEDNPPSKLRRVLGAVAGITSGVLQGPAAGIYTHDAITDQPYNSKLKDYNQKVALQGQAAQGEIGDVSRASTQEEQLARKQAEEARARAEEARRQDFVYRESPTAHERKLEELKIQHGDKAVFHEAKLKNGSVVYLKRDAVSGRLVNTDNNMPVDMNAIDTLSDPNKSLKQSAEEKIPAVLQAGIKAREIIADPKNAGTPAYDAAQEYLKNLSAGKDPKTSFDAVKDKTNEERKAKGLPEMSSSELTTLAKQLQPEQHFSTLMIDPNSNKVLNPKPGQVLPPGSRTLSGESQVNTPTAATRGRGEAAQTAIAAGKDVQSFADQNRNKLGNLADYWNNFTSNTPVADPTVEKFRGKVMSWAAFQASAHGFRASTVMREFESRVGTTKDVNSVISAIQGINDELQHAVDTGKGVAPNQTNDGWSVKVVQ